MPIKFGTDGWRALMDKDFTFENVELVSQAFADLMLKQSKKPRIVVGYDWRKDSENFAKRAAEIFVGNGIDVLLSETACPTPSVSYAIVSQKYDAGVAITASHNPPGYNGFKIKSDYGGSAEKSVTDAVEGLIGKNPVKKAAFKPGNPVIQDLNRKHLDYTRNYLKLDVIKKSPYRLLVDSMHGIGGRNIENLLAGGSVKVKTIRADRDVTFGGTAPEPIPQYLKPSMDLMKTGDFDFCIVTDGDADRVGAVAPGGEFISPGIILAIILMHFAEDLKKTGSVVTTISNTGLIYKVARKFGLKVHETPVGFKYVTEIMRREKVLIGGEESGGIGCPDYLLERDGVLSGLLVLETMAMRRQSFMQILEAMWKEFGRLYYVRQDIEYPNELKPKLFSHLQKNRPADFIGHKVKSVNDKDGMKFVFEDDSWLLFRLSGTEPMLRVYSEATSQALAEDFVKAGKELAFNLPKNV